MSTNPSGFRRTRWEEELEHTTIWQPEDALDGDPPLLFLLAAAPREVRGTVLAIQPGDVFGRSEQADVRWDDARVSRRHARFTLEHDSDEPEGSPPVFFVWPLEARHGVLLNGEAIRGATRLHENDEIQMGDTRFVIKVLS